MTRILALDISLTTAGVCRLTDTVAGQPWFEAETVKVPPLRVPGKRPGKMRDEPRAGADRLCWWKDWLIEEICRFHDAHNVTDFVVAVEQLAFCAQIAEIAKLYGVIEVTCRERNVPLVYVAIKTIKKHATGMGDCDKQRMIDTAFERFGSQIVDEHTADAAWLCDYVHAFHLGENGLNQTMPGLGTETPTE